MQPPLKKFIISHLYLCHKSKGSNVLFNRSADRRNKYKEAVKMLDLIKDYNAVMRISKSESKAPYTSTTVSFLIFYRIWQKFLLSTPLRELR